MADNSTRSTLIFRRRPRDASRPLVTVVVPVYNEEACLEALHARLTDVLAALGEPYEILLVDDGSRDRSLEIIRRLAARDGHVGYVTFTRNFGHEAATTCGMNHARGQTVVIIDADLQDPPEIVPKMVEAWEQGARVVYGVRQTRQEGAVVTFLRRAFYRVISARFQFFDVVFIAIAVWQAWKMPAPIKLGA